MQSVFPARCPHRSAQQHTEKQKKSKQFACLLDVLKSGILNIWKSARILRSSGFWNFFQIWKIPLESTSKVHEKGHHFCRLGTHTAPHSFGRKKLPHFTWPARVLTSGISQIRKKFKNPEIPGILARFSDLQNSTFKYPYRLWEVPTFLPPRHSHRYPHSYGPKK